MSIFRKEALQYQCVRLSGTVSLRADRHSIRAAWGFMALSALALVGFTHMEVRSSAPLSCQVTRAGQAQVGATQLQLGDGARLERIDIDAGAGVVALVPAPGDRGGARTVPLAASAGQCSATAHLLLKPGQLIVAKLTKQP